jgi:hypothetical protein
MQISIKLLESIILRIVKNILIIAALTKNMLNIYARVSHEDL